MAEPRGFDDAGTDAERDELLYVSWGGTGRAATVREALIRAGGSGCRLVYLAILDDGTFGDIESPMLDLAGGELAWLLDAQLDLIRSQANLDDVAVRVDVRSGDVVERVVEAADAGRMRLVLVGPPVGLADVAAVHDLVDRIGQRLTIPVEVVDLP